jgi:hypothetical protein
MWTRLLDPDSKTIRELTSAEFGTYVKLLLLAGKSDLKGKIALGEGIPYTDEQVRLILAETMPEYGERLAQLIRLGKITRDPDGTLVACRWQDFQTEYDRQEKYRDKLQRKVIGKGYSTEERREKKEGEEEKEKDTPVDGKPACPSPIRLLEYLYNRVGPALPGAYGQDCQRDSGACE